MPPRTPSEVLTAEVKKTAHMGRVAERTDHIDALTQLLGEDDKTAVLNTLQERGFGFEKGFDAKELSEIKDAIREAIAIMEENNNEVVGLSTAIKKGVEKATEATNKDLEGYETDLETLQVEWVKEKVEAGYERTKVVNAPLFGRAGIPPFPTKKNVLKSALKGLTQKQVEFMMQEGRSPFTFQVKAVGPSNRIDLIENLLDGQPKRMNASNGQTQPNLEILLEAREHMSARKNASSGIEWKWDFYQAEQIIDNEDWDDQSLTIEDRLLKYKEKWQASGMRGTDRWSLATAMADGLERGNPMDVRFKDGSSDTTEYEQWNLTVADEEGVLTHDDSHFFVCSNFDPGGRGTHLDIENIKSEGVGARFRASCDGSIEG